MEDKSKLIAENIKRLRQKNELSASDLARQASISKGYLYQLENEQNISPSIDILFKIAGALGVTIADLIEEENVATESKIDIPFPPALAEAVSTYKILIEDAQMLASIKMRGKYPKTKEDWFTLYNVIKNSIGK